jgi:hypothetical protein
MKKLTFLLLSTMAIGLTFISCGEKKDSNFLLEGKWVYFQKGIESKNVAVLEAYLHEPQCGKNYVEFLKDGIVNEGTYSYDENCDLVIDSGTWFKKKDKITITFPKAGTETAEIITLDETTLKVKAKVNNEIIIYVYKKLQ